MQNANFPSRIAYLEEFPKNRDFYLLDSEEKIKSFKHTNINDPEYIYVYSEDNKKFMKIFIKQEILWLIMILLK